MALKFALTLLTVVGVKELARPAPMDSFALRAVNWALNGILVAHVVPTASVECRQSAPKVNLVLQSALMIHLCANTAHQVTIVSQVLQTGS